ncbi:hypothetical protein BC938DRAFT_478166 [Jimgerdemannia flammicorona]|uniref:Uncharacterized protein n=1 Tax=Jimgerdemannia flammicorona TaxID=994334 RepID=A0A433QNC6_9FUNG|nr:hypothetical protein BC938DRAFT_478166 [Jimgerdemannia flammicorona]
MNGGVVVGGIARLVRRYDWWWSGRRRLSALDQRNGNICSRLRGLTMSWIRYTAAAYAICFASLNHRFTPYMELHSYISHHH